MSLPVTQPYSFPPMYAARRSAVKTEGGVRTALGIAGYMVLTIALTLFAGRAGAMASCVFLAVATIYCAAVNSPWRLPLFLGYAALEGLYKYTSDFSQIVYMVKPLLEIVLIGSLVQANRLRGLRLHFPPLTALFTMFAGWAVVEIFHPLGSGLLGAVGQLVIWYLAPMSLFWTGYNSLKTLKQVEVICYTLVAISVVVSLFAAFQYQMGQAWTMAHLPGYMIVNQGEWTITNAMGAVQGHSWRPASTSDMGGGGAQWAMWGSTIGAGLLLSKRINVFWKVLLLATICINTYGIILSGSRLYLIVAMLDGLLLFGILARSAREMARNISLLLVVGGMIWLGFSAAVSVSGGTITNRYSDTLADPLAKYNHDRIGLDGRSILLMRMLSQYPFGIGYQRGTAGGNAEDRQSTGYSVNRDDAFNSVAGDMGWPGLMFAIAIFFAVAIRSWSAFRKLNTPQTRLFGGIFLALMAGYLVCFFGGPVLNGADIFWLMLTIMLVMPRIQKLEQARGMQ